ncbi:MAG: hypothetical protein IJZ39_09170 [Oscillospiraceae bacterium]|nr:hypothetical protein [Oscillospiraceae bacterium]
MRRLKNALILLLTLALLGFGASLPQIAASVMDLETASQSGSQDMASIALEMGEEKPSLSTAGKIELLRRGQMISITEREAAMTTADVNAAVETAMAEYIEAGIFDWFDYTAWIALPKLCIDPGAPDHYGIFWTVTVVNDNDPYQNLVVDVDDETGKIFSIRYDRYCEFSLDGVWTRNAATMDAFVHIYLRQLGILDEQENVEPNIDYGELDEEVLYGGLFFENAEYGRTAIEFYVTGSGSFWVSFPE